MHPSVDKTTSVAPPAKNPTIEIDCACRAARPLLKESTMRNTIQALLCSLLASACAPIGEQGGGDFEATDAGAADSATSASCDQMETKTMDLSVSGTAAFNGLPGSCWKLDGKLTLSGAAVTSIAKLGDLREVKDLVVEDTALTALDVKHAFAVSGNVTIRNNTKLTDLSKVEAKPTIGSLTVEFNPELTSVGGLAKASVIAGLTKIASNNKLASVSLGTTTRLEGGLIISSNPQLATVDLHAVDSVGAIEIRSNAALTSLQLTALSQIHGNITIDSNAKLETLAGIKSGINLPAPYGISITNNAALKNISSLARAQYIWGNVIVTGNTQLPFTAIHEVDCCADTGQLSASNNAGTQCSGGHWCLTNGNTQCPF
jgi:hypothetical protein